MEMELDGTDAPSVARELHYVGFRNTLVNSGETLRTFFLQPTNDASFSNILSRYRRVTIWGESAGAGATMFQVSDLAPPRCQLVTSRYSFLMLDLIFDCSWSRTEATQRASSTASWAIAHL